MVSITESHPVSVDRGRDHSFATLGNYWFVFMVTLVVLYISALLNVILEEDSEVIAKSLAQIQTAAWKVSYRKI